MKKKILNFRYIFVFAVLFALGLFYAKDLFSGGLAAIILCSLVFVFFLIWGIRDRSWIKVVLPLVAFVVGIGLFALCDSTYFRGVTTDGEYAVRGRVEYVNKEYDTTQMLILSNVEIEGKKQSKNIYIKYRKSGKGLEVGDEIEFVGTLDKVSLWNMGSLNTFYYKNKIASFCSLSSGDKTLIKSEKKLGEKFQEKIKDKLFENMTEENAEISYASIFGDKSGIDEEIQNAFSAVGVAHLLAISGLHIGFFVGLLSFVLSKCRLHKKWHVLIIAPILFVYCYLCRFSPSVLRATIMSVVALLAHSFGRKNDSLTTFSIALVLVLLVRPLDIFDGGLQLSFLCVFSLIILSPIIQKGFNKIKLEKLGKVLSPVLAVQIGTLPVLMKLFKSISLLTILANMICVPIFEAAYILLMALLPFSFIPHFGVILIAPEFLLQTIAMTAILLSEKSAFITLPYLGKDVTVVYIFFLFGVSRFVMTSISHKMMLTLGLVLVMAVLFFASFFQYGQKDQSILFVGTSDIFVIKEKNDNYLINLSNKFDNNESKLINCLNYCKIYHVKKVFSQKDIDISSISQLKKAELINSENKEMECFYIAQRLVAVTIKIGDKSFLFVQNLKDETDRDILEFNYEDRSFDVVVNLTDFKIGFKTKLFITPGDLKNNHNWTMSFQNDTLGLKRSLS